MADATLRKLIRLIGEGTPSLRRAAIAVSSEVGSAQQAALVQALLAVTEEEDPELRRAAIEALGRLRAESALPRLLELVRQGGADVEAAAEAAGCLGARGAKAIEKLMHELPTAQRSRVVAALAHGDTDAAAVAAAHALLDDDASVVSAAARSLAADIPKLPPGRRKALARYLIEKLSGREARRLSPASEAGMLRVLAALHDPASEAIFWSRIDPKRPASVRATALQALGHLGPPRNQKHIEALVQCALDADFQIAAPAMMLLQQVPATSKQIPLLVKLFDAPDVAIRRFAVEKLGSVQHPAIARGLTAQLEHSDRRLREAALMALQSTPTGRKAIIEALLEAGTPDAAWGLARAYSGELSPALRDRVFAQACLYYEAEDRRAEALFHLLRHADAAWTRDQIETRAFEYRRKKNYAAAVNYLRLLARDAACGPAIRFELAATGLKIADHNLAPEARQAEPSLAQFSRLLQDRGFDLFGHLAKAKYLDAEDLFYLGFHFAEQNGPAQEFGGKVLQLLIKRAPNSARAKDARRKLASAGFDL